jgi:ParB family chromosome partitioning protein
MIENMQRDDLNPIEESSAYQRLSKSFGLTQEQISASVGKSRAYIANSLRLLELPDAIRDAVATGRISVGHAKVLLSISDKKIQTLMAYKCQAQGMTVRQLETYVSGGTGERQVGKSKAREADITEMEARLSRHFGTRVRIEQGKRRGRICIEFYRLEDFDRITGLMGLT